MTKIGDLMFWDCGIAVGSSHWYVGIHHPIPGNRNAFSGGYRRYIDDTVLLLNEGRPTEFSGFYPSREHPVTIIIIRPSYT